LVPSKRMQHPFPVSRRTLGPDFRGANSSRKNLPGFGKSGRGNIRVVNLSS
jgi:hypothetical protein